MKKIMLLTIMALFSIPLSAGNKKASIYRDELKAFKKSADSELMFSEDANQSLVHIQRSIEISKELGFFSKLARFMFMGLDPVIVKPSTMPQLYGYIDGVCKKSNIATPTIFITSDKHGFFNAFASKLFATTGGIIVEQKMIYETSELELEAVLAHEIGHIKHNHINKAIAISLLSTLGAYLATAGGIELYRKLSETQDMPYTEAQVTLKSQATLLAAIFLPKFIINKRFEKEADLFACQQDKAEGVIEFFEDILDREANYDKDFDNVYALIKGSKSQISTFDYFGFWVGYYLAKGGHHIDKVVKYLYHNTPLGDHPSHEARIDAVKEYLALQQSDWNVA
jgi:Zn-dependent protease with chaperone function